MKGIETKAAEPMTLAAGYEPLTMRFGREILARMVRMRKGRSAVRLLFAKPHRPVIRQSFFQRKRIVRFDTRLDLHLHTEMASGGISWVRPKRGGVRILPDGRKATGRAPLFMPKPSVAAKTTLSPAVAPHSRVQTASSSLGMISRPLLSFREWIRWTEERVVERKAQQRFKTERVVERQVVWKGADRYRTPVVLHYRTAPFAAMPVPGGNAKEEEKVRIETRKRELQREEVDETIAKQLIRYRREQIETISEKVYTLVMQKWEKERRRRGVLYE